MDQACCGWSIYTLTNLCTSFPGAAEFPVKDCLREGIGFGLDDWNCETEGWRDLPCWKGDAIREDVYVVVFASCMLMMRIRAGSQSDSTEGGG